MIEDVQEVVNTLRGQYRVSVERFFGDKTDEMIHSCREAARGLGVYTEVGATYAEATLIVVQVVSKFILDAYKVNPVLMFASVAEPMIPIALACALTYFVVTPEEITG